jgi:hypothetical protein
VPTLFSGDHRGSPLQIFAKLNHYRFAFTIDTNRRLRY